MEEKISSLEQITNFCDIEKLGLEQYTPLILRSFCLNLQPKGRVCSESDNNVLEKTELPKNLNATHYMMSLYRLFHEGSNYAIYAFVFYGPKRKPK